MSGNATASAIGEGGGAGLVVVVFVGGVLSLGVGGAVVVVWAGF